MSRPGRLRKFRCAGRVPNERWHAAGQVAASSLSTATLAIDTLWAVPEVFEEPVLLDGIAFEVTLGGTTGSVGRIGVYAPMSERNDYPGRLLWDGGEFTTTGTGAKASASRRLLLRPGLYWFVYLAGVAAPTVRSSSTLIRQFGGFPAALGAAAGVGLSIAHTYSAGGLPTVFPVSASWYTTGPPIVYFRTVDAGWHLLVPHPAAEDQAQRSHQ